MLTFSRMRSIFFTGHLPPFFYAQPTLGRGGCEQLEDRLGALYKLKKQNALEALLLADITESCPPARKACYDFGQSPIPKRQKASGLRAISWLGGQNILDRWIVQDRREGGIRVDGRKFLVAFVLGLAQIDQAALQIARLGKRFRQQEIK